MAVQAVFGGEPDAAENLLTMPRGGQRGLPGRRLGEQRPQVIVGRCQGRLGALERDQRLGEPVPYRLERRERPAELCPVKGVRPGERQHGPASAGQPPADGPPARGERGAIRRIGTP
jgi:hypothetical protein